MRICVLGSGSKGNSTYIEGDNTKILIDAGLSKLELEKRLSAIGVNPSEINSILITHEHSDHIAGIANFSKKYGCKIYAHKDIWPVLSNKFEKIPFENQIEFSGIDFNINELNISTMDLDHDSIHCVGFSVEHNKTKFSIATDLGHTTPQIIKTLSNSDLVVLEANHDIEKLNANPHYPNSLKRRILSDHGHLNNQSTADAIIQLLGKKTRGIILGHLSEENNTPELAIDTIKNTFIKNGAIVEREIRIDIAKQTRPSTIYKIKE
ncbi:MAG: MBL fold metallo-hydrolase [Clostridia bacterium]|nr:MBL fold metallo-hydrolase [Clostridia bacterium]